MFNLLIIDNHPVMTAGLSLFLKEFPVLNIVAATNSIEEGMIYLNNNRIDLLVMDLNQREHSGEQMLRMLAEKFPDIKKLVYSEFNKAFFIKTSLKYHVEGYLLKGSSKEYLPKAIKTILEGGQYYDENLIVKNIDDGLKDQIEANNRTLEKLSSREREVLELLCDGFKSKEIADKLKISIHTVRTYRARIMLKTEAKNVVTLVRRVKLGV